MKKVPLSNSNIPLFLRYLKLFDAEPHKKLKTVIVLIPLFQFYRYSLYLKKMTLNRKCFLKKSLLLNRT